jgi:hypothetical protein
MATGGVCLHHVGDRGKLLGGVHDHGRGPQEVQRPVGHTTVAKVAAILYQKDLLVRRLGDRDGTPGPPAWWYRAARPASEHIGALACESQDTLCDLCAADRTYISLSRTLGIQKPA